MAPNPKVAKACKAMKDYGIPEETVKPVLKKLLDLYEKNWEYIEQEKYRVLINAIFDSEDPKREEMERQESCLQDEPEEHEPPLKRYRLGGQTDQSSSSLGDSIHHCLGDRTTEPNSISPRVLYNRKGKKPSSPQGMRQTMTSQLFSNDQNADFNTLTPLTHLKDNEPPPFFVAQREEMGRQESCLQDEPEEHELPIKSYRLGGQTDQSSSSLGDSIHQCLGDRKTEPNTISPRVLYSRIGKKPSSPQGMRQTMPSQLFSNHQNADSNTLTPLTHLKNNELPVSLPVVQTKKRLTYESSTNQELKGMPNFALSPNENLLDEYNNDVIVPEGRNFANDMPLFEVPLAFILPDHPNFLGEGENVSSHVNCSDANKNGSESPELMHLDAEDICENGSSHGNCSYPKENGLEIPEQIDLDVEDISPPGLLCEDGSSNGNCSNFKGNGLKILDSTHLDSKDKEDNGTDSLQFDIASSSTGEVKIALICNSSRPSDFRILSLDAVLEAVEEKCLKSYRITEPSFSLLKLMKDVCEFFLAERTISTCDEQLRPVNVPPTLDVMNKFNRQSVLGARLDNLSNVSVKVQNLIEILPPIPSCMMSNVLDFLHCIIGLNVNGNDHGGRDRKWKAFEGQGSSNSSCTVTVQKHHPCFLLPNSSYYIDDITKGEENRKISLVNEISNECQPTFTYIPKSIPHQNAYVKFLLARISDENCCSNCFGDCLSLPIPCACAGETGSEFAYARGGLVKEKFLEKCILMNGEPQKHLFYCKVCPLERSKDKSFLGRCEGHLVRNFIKECWYKCGCTKNCGNRVVQRGITANLQVFMTPEGKGWGLRTLEDLPKGAFVCEYVGEIVTNSELFERNMGRTGEKHTYPVLLDADWGSEDVLKDEEALCLDATFYGNVARFVNHRCCDANLVEIPVEVETPDHHYYHLAFFTTRKVDALEELTWDYGIDFDDHGHPVKAFQCHCGSKFCRNMKRRKRTRSRS